MIIKLTEYCLSKQNQCFRDDDMMMAREWMHKANSFKEYRHTELGRWGRILRLNETNNVINIRRTQ